MQTLKSFSDEITGYLSPIYARSLAEFGNPRHLTNSNGWIIERRIPGSESVDGLGCYPLICCTDWAQLGADLRVLRSDLISLAVVADPFGSYELALLKKNFDRVVRFNPSIVDCVLRICCTYKNRSVVSYWVYNMFHILGRVVV